jgi:hypothetical protein
MRTTIRLSIILLAALSYLTLFVSCKEENNEPEPMVLDCNSFTNSSPDKITQLEDRGIAIDYIIDCTISVDIDLTIAPGVTIAFTNGAGMWIREDGSLNATGTPDKPIVFTGTDKVKGSWKGIISYSNDVKNKLDNVAIEYAGGGSFNSNGDLGALILWADARFIIENTTIKSSAAYGLNCNYSRYTVSIQNLTVTDCEMPVNTADPNMISGIQSGSFTGNAVDAIKIGKPGGPALSGTHSWIALDAPYRISRSLIVKDSRLTIQPGVIIEFENGTGIKVGDSDESTLIAIGTPANPITFTGVTKVAGAWENIDFHFTKSPLNEISHAIIEYGGNPGSGGVVYMWAKSVVKVTNVTFSEIGSCAIYAAPSTSNPNENLTESNNTMINVAGGYLCGD